MAFRAKRKTPVDRAVADLEAQIAALQHQMRELEAGSEGRPSASTMPSKADGMTKFVKDMLTPPAKKLAAPSYRARKDLFDVPTEPVKELEAVPIAFAQKPESSLFAQQAGQGTAAQVACV